MLNCWLVLSVFTLLSGNLRNSLILQHSDSLPIKQPLFLPVSGSWPLCLLFLWIRRPSFPRVRGITQNLPFCAWLISLHTRSSGFIHVASVRISSPPPLLFLFFLFCLRLIYLAGRDRGRARERIWSRLCAKGRARHGSRSRWKQNQGSGAEPAVPPRCPALPSRRRPTDTPRLHKPRHAYPFLHRRVLGLLLRLGCCEWCVCEHGCVISLQDPAFRFLDTYPEAELLGHMMIPFFIFWGTLVLFSIGTVPFYISTTSVQGFHFLHTLTNTCDFLFVW